MVTTPPVDEEVQPRPVRARRRHTFYASRGIAAEAESAGSVCIDVSFQPDSMNLDLLLEAVATTPSLPEHVEVKTGATMTAKAVREAVKSVVAEAFSRRFAAEIAKVVDAYRLMLRESLAKGEDPELKAALNRARLQEKILASTSMVDQAQACQLLGLSQTNPSATMKRKEDKQELLRFTIDGRAVYPLFQFNVEGRRIFPAMARLIAEKPRSWSDFRLLHWLTRPNLDVNGTPAEALGRDEHAVMAAFEREVEPAAHG